MTDDGLRVCKLVSGEFVVGRMMGLNLINFFLISFKANPISGQITTNLIPYMSPLDHSLSHVLDMTKIMSMSNATPDMVQLYVSTLTGFIQAQQKQTSEENKDGTTGQNPIPEQSDTTETEPAPEES